MGAQPRCPEAAPPLPPNVPAGGVAVTCAGPPQPLPPSPGDAGRPANTEAAETGLARAVQQQNQDQAWGHSQGPGGHGAAAQPHAAGHAQAGHQAVQGHDATAQPHAVGSSVWHAQAGQEGVQVHGATASSDAAWYTAWPPQAGQDAVQGHRAAAPSYAAGSNACPAQEVGSNAWPAQTGQQEVQAHGAAASSDAVGSSAWHTQADRQAVPGHDAAAHAASGQQPVQVHGVAASSDAVGSSAWHTQAGQGFQDQKPAADVQPPAERRNASWSWPAVAPGCLAVRIERITMPENVLQQRLSQWLPRCSEYRFTAAAGRHHASVYLQLPEKDAIELCTHVQKHWGGRTDLAQPTPCTASILTDT